MWSSKMIRNWQILILDIAKQSRSFLCFLCNPSTAHAHMWQDQGEWVTCRQYSISIFQFKLLVHLKCYILIQTPPQSDIWLQRYEQFFKLKNNIKCKNLSSLLSCNSKSIFLTSDSFPLIMSHIVGTNWPIAMGLLWKAALQMNYTIAQKIVNLIWPTSDSYCLIPLHILNTADKSYSPL